MSETILSEGESFPAHFVWKLPDGDYLRAVFAAEILSLDWRMERYMVRLGQLQAGRQETPAGEARPEREVNRLYVALVRRLIGRRVQLAFEAVDGRPLLMRLPTLTGEHNFFFRYDTDEEA